MKIISKAYKHLGNYMLTGIVDDQPAPQPIFGWCDYWCGQTENVGDDGEINEEYAFDCPAIFLDFIVIECTSKGLWTQDALVQIDIYLAFDILADTHIGASDIDTGIQFLDHLDKVHAMLEGYSHPDVGNLTRVQPMKPMRTRSNLLVYKLTYQTYLRDSSATDARKKTETITVNAELAVTKRPHVNPGGTGSGESYFDLT